MSPSKQAPKILYKYRAFNSYALEMLAKNQIYFASPLDFNDPFDCLAHEGVVEDFRRDIEDIIATNATQQELSSEQITAHLKKINENIEIIQARTQTDADFQSSLDYIKNDMGIVSLSSCNNSILMWAHYGDFHKGFCIGFKNNLGMPVGVVHKVSYSTSINRNLLSQFFLNSGSEDQFLEEIQNVGILTKYHDWEYEKEWRIIGVKGVGTYDDSCIGEIIFGLKMPQENRNILVSTLNGKKINYFEAVKSKSDFAIDIIPVANTNT